VGFVNASVLRINGKFLLQKIAQKLTIRNKCEEQKASAYPEYFTNRWKFYLIG
jgi:hypothetical protein